MHKKVATNKRQPIMFQLNFWLGKPCKMTQNQRALPIKSADNEDDMYYWAA